jgi:glutaminyl-tRNA synthetase
MDVSEATQPLNFIQNIIEADLKLGKNAGKVVTRFPPEPNGYLHMGHAQSININFGLALRYGGVCHLRMDDTNPAKEDVEYVESIQQDVKWLGFDWGVNYFHASDYFGQLYDFAVDLIKLGKAYVCDLTAEQVRQYRGTLTEPGRSSPNRDRSVEENLDLFARMRAGEFEDGSKTLRAKIDMASPNINLRDPAIYRIRKVHHHRTGDAWCIYPMYDYAHCLSDSIEGITHSICTLEFENHRPLYDWYLDTLGVACHPQQIEFSRLNVRYTVMSKRKLNELVKLNIVNGWDDPRMPTIAGLRRRGYPPEAIRGFAEKTGVTKSDSRSELSFLEECVRDYLNDKAKRVMAVLHPIKVVITNYPEGQSEDLPAAYYPEDIGIPGERQLPFGREIYIDADDFMEDPPKKYFRLSPGKEVRLRRAYIIRCNEVIKDQQGNLVELHCTYDPETKSGSGVNRKVQGTIHWVSATHALDAEVRLYDKLFAVDNPDAYDGDYKDCLNPDSLHIVQAKVEPSLADAPHGERYQFERQGFFAVDPDSSTEKLVFNRIVSLKDSWSKIVQKGAANG